MKHLRTILLAVSALAILGTSALAAGTATVTVTADVIGACQFSAATYALPALTLDPTNGTAQTSNGTIDYWCTTGTTALTLTANNGAQPVGGVNQLASGGNLIPYTFSLGALTGAVGGGPAAPISVPISATVAGAAYVNAVAGTYTDKSDRSHVVL